MFKKVVFSLSLLLFSLSLFSVLPARAQEESTDLNLYLFWSKNCPHCTKEKIFLESLVQKYPQLKVNLHEISNSQSAKLLQKAARLLSADTGSIPFTIIGDNYIVGYQDEETTGSQIESLVKNCLETNACPDILSSENTRSNPSLPENFKIPFFGDLKSKNLSLPLITFLIALVDGFNPCAMWTLLFLISLLLNMKDRKRMWILGFSFIGASAFVYFLFLAAWLNIFLFLGFVGWIRVLIGLVALFAAYYQLKDFFVNQKGGCKTVDDQKRQRVFAKLKTITQNKSIFLALLGIILLAFAVNLVELICSAGLPAIFTQILALNHLSSWQYYAYLLFYIFIFMLDDLVVFYLAMRTLHAVGIESKYARLSRLVGGILILIIGLLMLFKPELLTFA
jgi:glutaredoxin